MCPAWRQGVPYTPERKRALEPRKPGSGADGNGEQWGESAGERERQAAEQAGETNAEDRTGSLGCSWILFSPFGLSLFNGSSTMNLSNKHETRKMYFENKGAGQVLLGAPEKEAGGRPLRGQGGFRGGWGRLGPASPGKQTVGGWGARQRECYRKDTADFKGSGRVANKETDPPTTAT